MSGRAVAISVAVALVVGVAMGLLIASLQDPQPTRVPPIEVESSPSPIEDALPSAGSDGSPLASLRVLEPAREHDVPDAGPGQNRGEADADDAFGAE